MIQCSNFMKPNTLWVDRLKKATFTPQEYGVLRLLWQGNKARQVKYKMGMTANETIALLNGLNHRLRMLITAYSINNGRFYREYALKCPLPPFRPK